MKTTIEIADSLLTEAKELAKTQGTTLRALVEEGLRQVLEERGRESSFRITRATFKGRGLQANVEEGVWRPARADGERFGES